jgi:hypothetical protein
LRHPGACRLLLPLSMGAMAAGASALWSGLLLPRACWVAAGCWLLLVGVVWQLL